jgi:hypothetical protein
MHDVFHVSFLCHYISDPSHVIDLISLQVSAEGALIEEPIHILDNAGAFPSTFKEDTWRKPQHPVGVFQIGFYPKEDTSSEILKEL